MKGDWEIEKEIKYIKKDIKGTKIVKNRFINEMKNGLGDEIKKNLESKAIIERKDNMIVRFFKNIFKL